MLSDRLIRIQLMLNRPPPYFPQNQLSPPDEKKYRRFKLIVAGIAFFIVVVLAGIGYGIYSLISYLLTA